MLSSVVDRSPRVICYQTSTMLTVLSLTFFIGCSGNDESLPATAAVTGTVTYQGKKLTEGTVMFFPKGIEGAKPGSAEISPEGVYTLTTYDAEDGAAIGTHKVTVQVFPAGGNPGEEAEGSIIPEKYFAESTTELEFEVKAGENTIDIPLTD